MTHAPKTVKVAGRLATRAILGVAEAEGARNKSGSWRTCNTSTQIERAQPQQSANPPPNA